MKWNWESGQTEVCSLSGWMGGDAIYRIGSNLALLPAPKPRQTWLNIACHVFQMRLKSALESSVTVSASDSHCQPIGVCTGGETCQASLWRGNREKDLPSPLFAFSSVLFSLGHSSFLLFGLGFQLNTVYCRNSAHHSHMSVLNAA